VSCVWLLCHPVAGVRLCVIGEAYQDREGRRSSQEGRQDRAHGVEGLKDVVVRSMLMHREIEEDRPQPDQVDGSRGSVPSDEEWDSRTVMGRMDDAQSSPVQIRKNSRPKCDFGVSLEESSNVGSD